MTRLRITDDIWITAKPILRHPHLPNYLGYQKNSLVHNLTKSLPLNGTTRGEGNNVIFQSTYNDEELQIFITEQLEKLNKTFMDDIVKNSLEETDTVGDIIWVEETIMGDSEIRNIFPAQYAIYTRDTRRGYH